MKLLGVESSSSFFSVALSDGGSVSGFSQVQGQGRPSSLLTELIEQVTAEAGVKLSELDGFALSVGPGSFTGLRVGVTTVKTLAWALKKPVLPVSSLEVIAQNARGRSENLLLFLDARKGNVYSACFSPDGGRELRRVTPDELLLPGEALGRIRGPTLILGDGLKRYSKLLEEAGIPSVEAAAEDLWIPRADSLCRIADSIWPQGLVDDLHRLVPQYFYGR